MPGWAAALGSAVVVAVLAALALEHRATKQRLRNQDGLVAGLRMDLESAQARIVELQTYLSDHDSWQTDPAPPVPAEVADRTMPDRWSVLRPAGEAVEPEPAPEGSTAPSHRSTDANSG